MYTQGNAALAHGLVSLNDIPVAIVRWPEEAPREAGLASEGQLRLLLVAPTATPPSDWDPLADWIRLPAADADIWRRVAGLQRRVRHDPEPSLDEFGVVWRGRRWVSLAPAEARLFAVLLERPGSVCSRPSLTRRAWPNSPVNDNLLNAYIKRVRRRVLPLGLAIHTVRQRGYFLEVDPHPTSAVPTVDADRVGAAPVGTLSA